MFPTYLRWLTRSFWFPALPVIAGLVPAAQLGIERTP
jgi:hypothetical protein